MSVFWENFQCQRCGNCCSGDLPYDNKRIRDIAAFLNITTDDLFNKYYGKIMPDGSAEWDDSKRTPCPFGSYENNTHQCNIYSVRPEGCRLFPFGSDCGCAGVDCPAAKITYELVRKIQSVPL